MEMDLIIDKKILNINYNNYHLVKKMSGEKLSSLFIT